MGSEPAKVRGHPSRFVPIFRLIFVVGFFVLGFFVLGHRHVLAAVRAAKVRSLDFTVVNYENFCHNRGIGI